MPSATARSKSGSCSEYAIWRAIPSSIPYSDAKRLTLSVKSSGILIAAKYSSETGTGKTSVSGYIRAAPGSGRMYAVDPPSSIFLVSSGTPSNAIFARRIIIFIAHLHFCSVAATIMTASCSPAPKVSFKMCTSSSVTPYAGSSSVWNRPPTPHFFA